jgi:hypothetical protein
VRLMLLTAPAQIAPVLELMLAGNAAQVGDAAFRQELVAWLRFSTASAVGTRDGLYAACSGNPVLPNWLGRLMFGQFFTEAAENDKLARQVGSSSGLAIFVSDRDDPAHWVAAGRSYQRFALQATALGLKHAFFNQAVEVPATRADMADLLQLGTGRPDFILRFGRGPEMPRSLRRAVADVMVAA